eukprot:gene8948-9870_t
MAESVRAPPIKKGWMTKQGRSGIVKNWKKRFFVLMAGKIQYYVRDLKDYPFGEELRGELSLVNTEITSSTSLTASQIYLTSFNGENNMLMQAASPEEAGEWKLALKQHIQYANISTEETVLQLSLNRSSVKPPMTTPSIADSRATSIANDDEASRTTFVDVSKRELPPPTPSDTSATSTSTSSSSSQPAESSSAALTLLLDSFLAFLLDAERRKAIIRDTLPGFRSAFQASLESANTGDFGTRGEELLIPAFLLTIVIFVSFMPRIVFLINIILPLVGSILIATGIVMTLNAIWELKENCSLFLQPPKQIKRITTSGVYGVVRHPMYGGIILTAFGVAMVQGHIYKVFSTLALAAILNKAAEIEEDALERAFPKEYPTYTSNRNVFVPFLY